MITHKRTNCFDGSPTAIKENSGAIVMCNVSQKVGTSTGLPTYLEDVAESVSTKDVEIAFHCGTLEVPSFLTIMKEFRVGVLKICHQDKPDPEIRGR